MNDIGKLINDLIKSSGKTAPKMTNALKNIGNGDMQAGIARIADYFTKEGLKVGQVRGLIGGIAIGGVAVGSLIFLIQKVVKEHKKDKEEGEAILKGLEEGITDYENNNGEDTTCDIVIEEMQEDDSSELPNE